MENISKKFKKHDKDVGSSSLQIISLTKKILTISQHAKQMRNDKHCRTGIVKLVSRRKALMRYMKRTENSLYHSLIKELGLRG
jgi:small subunit ribosomal protein S15